MDAEAAPKPHISPLCISKVSKLLYTINFQGPSCIRQYSQKHLILTSICVLVQTAVMKCHGLPGRNNTNFFLTVSETENLRPRYKQDGLCSVPLLWLAGGRKDIFLSYCMLSEKILFYF